MQQAESIQKGLKEPFPKKNCCKKGSFEAFKNAIFFSKQEALGSFPWKKGSFFSVLMIIYVPMFFFSHHPEIVDIKTDALFRS